MKIGGRERKGRKGGKISPPSPVLVFLPPPGFEGAPEKEGGFREKGGGKAVCHLGVERERGWKKKARYQQSPEKRREMARGADGDGKGAKKLVLFVCFFFMHHGT